MPPLRLAEVVALLEARYPPATAEPWDAVGLVVGEPVQEVRRVLLAVDPVAETVREAVEWGADLLLTHHPLLLTPVHSVSATTAKGRAVHSLIRAGCALYTAHTNADGAAGGVSEQLARAVGLERSRPIRPRPADAIDALVTYVPVGRAPDVIDALAAAGAGAIGDYEKCAWRTDGLGQFLPRPGARPAVGEVGRIAEVAETRVEMVLPRSRRSAVVAALRSAHPYEEPAFSVLEVGSLEGDTGHGRLGELSSPVTLQAFAERVAAALPATAHGVRVSGDLDEPVRTVAVCGGSGDSFLSAVAAQGADVYVTADLRHHRASEAREEGRLGRPYLVDVAHWASEWPWLPAVAEQLREDVRAAGSTVETRVSTAVTDPWAAHLASPDAPALDPFGGSS